MNQIIHIESFIWRSVVHYLGWSVVTLREALEAVHQPNGYPRAQRTGRAHERNLRSRQTGHYLAWRRRANRF